ncbi:hypothetical protein [Halalkalibacter lacteus]|uniref:hypothetical protein n=1 Tax=Halalkalibacter lacteus TaxID=3090663 RepID=UPI002FC60D9F
MIQFNSFTLLHTQEMLIELDEQNLIGVGKVWYNGTLVDEEEMPFTKDYFKPVSESLDNRQGVTEASHNLSFMLKTKK